MGSEIFHGMFPVLLNAQEVDQRCSTAVDGHIENVDEVVVHGDHENHAHTLQDVVKQVTFHGHHISVLSLCLCFFT